MNDVPALESIGDAVDVQENLRRLPMSGRVVAGLVSVILRLGKDIGDVVKVISNRSLPAFLRLAVKVAL